MYINQLLLFLAIAYLTFPYFYFYFSGPGSAYMVTGAKGLNDQNKLPENNKNVPQTQNQNFTPGNQGYGISFENQQTFSQQYCLELADICLPSPGRFCDQ